MGYCSSSARRFLIKACGFFFFLGGGDASAAVASRPVEAPRGDRSSAVRLWRDLLRRVASWNLLVGRADGVDGCAFYSWSSRASPRGSSVRVGRSSTALGRGLFRHVPSSWFLPVGRADGVASDALCAGFSELLSPKKVPFGYRGRPPLAETIARKQILSLHRTTRAKQTETALCTPSQP